MGLRRKPDAVQGFPADGAAPPGDDSTEGARVRVFVHRAHAPEAREGLWSRCVMFRSDKS